MGKYCERWRYDVGMNLEVDNRHFAPRGSGTAPFCSDSQGRSFREQVGKWYVERHGGEARFRYQLGVVRHEFPPSNVDSRTRISHQVVIALRSHKARGSRYGDTFRLQFPLNRESTLDLEDLLVSLSVSVTTRPNALAVLIPLSPFTD